MTDNLSVDVANASDSKKRPVALHLNTVEIPRTLFGRLWYWWSLTVVALLLLIVGLPFVVLFFLINRRVWLYPFALFGARWWLKLSRMKVAVRGMEHLDPQQSYVFVANHRSYVDTATLFAYTGRRMGIIAKKEILKVPVLGQGMGYVNILAIDRTNNERAVATMKEATNRLESGVSFGIFAEGTRALPGQLLPFKKGAFYMAVEAKVPIVPVAIKNTDYLMGKKTGVAYPGTIEMIILPPITITGKETDAEVAALANTARLQIAEALRG